jgi:hypothetical protein
MKGVVAAAAVAGGVLAGLRRSRDWGATAGEVVMPLPGDELVAEPADAVTRAVEIAAPAAEVWRWLVQIGQGRGGMYSYDRLENLVGLDIHSTDEIRAEWQRLDAGDEVVVVPPGWGPLAEGYALEAARVLPGEAIVLLQSPPRHPWRAVWTFVIVPVAEDRCRLLSRSRAARASSRTLQLATGVLEPVTTVMTRRMLLGIRDRAERSWRSRTAEPAVAS